MLSSRDIDLLRSDVAANCRKFIALAKADGWPVLVTGTVRDEEYQKYCYDNGTANTPYPSFHSVKAGLAFDICKNVKGEEYSDSAFWTYCGALGRKMGFEWGGLWKSIVDKPHFQWSDGGKYTSSMIRAGKYPPEMPLYEEAIETVMEVEEVTQEQFDTMMNNYLSELAKKDPSDWSQEARNWAEGNGIIFGDENGNKQYKAFCTREQMAQFLYRMSQK